MFLADIDAVLDIDTCTHIGVHICVEFWQARCLEIYIEVSIEFCDEVFG